MAKKQKSSSASDILKELDGISIGTAEEVSFLSTGSPVLDWLCSNRFVGGGIPIGRVIELFGDPSTAKSLVGYSILAQVQQMGGIAILDDVENSFEPQWVRRCGLDIDNLVIISHKDADGNIRGSATVGEHYAVVDNVLSKLSGKVPLIGIMLDSMAQLSTTHEQEADFGVRDMTKAQEVRKLMRKLVSKVKSAKAVYIVCNHVISNFGRHGTVKVAPGGSGVPFGATLRIQLSNPRQIKNKHQETIGVDIKAYIPKNRIAPPFKEAKLRVLWNKGLDTTSGLFELCLRAGVIEEAGRGWYQFADGSGNKCRRNDFKYDEMLKHLSAIELDEAVAIDTIDAGEEGCVEA